MFFLLPFGCPDHCVCSFLPGCVGQGLTFRGNTDNLRLTVRFTGSVDDRQYAAIQKPRFIRCRLFRFYCRYMLWAFSQKQEAPHILWAGIAFQAALMVLQTLLEKAFVCAGMPPKNRSCFPHITRVYFKRALRQQCHVFMQAYSYLPIMGRAIYITVCWCLAVCAVIPPQHMVDSMRHEFLVLLLSGRMV